MRRILCVGQNYAAHAREMGGDPSRAPPFFFTKPGDALVTDGAESDLSVGDGRTCITRSSWSAPSAMDGEIAGWAVGCDLTRRDLQAESQGKGPAVGRGQGV